MKKGIAMNQYLSIRGEAAYEMTEKKSRFICSVKPVSSEEEALAFIRQVSKSHKDANHNVFAYVVMSNYEIMKASDDGEPQGTAGIPVLEVIKKSKLTNICVVVTRYFGGTLLGAGGLIRAYSASAKLGIEKAGICSMSLFKKIKVITEYSYLGKLQNTLTYAGCIIINIEYTECITLNLKVRFDKIDITVKSINEITNGSAKIEMHDEFYDINE